MRGKKDTLKAKILLHRARHADTVAIPRNRWTAHTTRRELGKLLRSLRRRERARAGRRHTTAEWVAKNQQRKSSKKFCRMQRDDTFSYIDTKQLATT